MVKVFTNSDLYCYNNSHQVLMHNLLDVRNRIIITTYGSHKKNCVKCTLLLGNNGGAFLNVEINSETEKRNI